MEFGICLPTKANSWQVVKRAEELGFNYVWFYDTHLLSADVLVAMGAAAVKTSRIKLCAGVLIPSNRIAPVAANALGRVLINVAATTPPQGPLLERSGHEPQGKTGRIG